MYLSCGKMILYGDPSTDRHCRYLDVQQQSFAGQRGWLRAGVDNRLCPDLAGTLRRHRVWFRIFTALDHALRRIAIVDVQSKQPAVIFP